MQQSFTVKAPAFEGPLEALLDMIEERKLPVSAVSLAEVCDSYIAYVESLPALPLPETSQFILVASTLLLIKSRSLLPLLELTEEEREGVEELERRLARLSLVRKAARRLRASWGTAPLSLALTAPARPPVFKPAEVSIAALRDAARRILRTLPKPIELLEAVVAPTRSLEEVIAEVRGRLSQAVRARFSELTARTGREEAILYFLAVLELVRSGGASVVQDRLFADITIELEDAGLPRYG